MPVLDSDYRPPFYLRSGHLQTIYPSLFRKVPLICSDRERIETPDHDFIDIDWALSESSLKLAIITHGLEGHSRSQYCQGMARAFIQDGWSVCVWNLRGCSGHPNRLLESYHSGSSDDLHLVIEHALKTKTYTSIALIGFSLGGNITLKYVAENASSLHPAIQATAGISVACDLAGCAQKLERWDNWIYMRRFLQSLTKKVRYKMDRFPGQIEDHGLATMRTFRQFDGAYTAPIHGFQDADDYWSRCSSGPMLKDIRIPTLLLNALNDPFLTPKCYPYADAEKSNSVYLETPRYGGHMGFMQSLSSTDTYAEKRVAGFIKATYTND